MEGPEIQFAEAVIDNGRYGKRVVRFETGLLAQQAAGSTLVSIDDDTTLLSTTAIGKKPRDGFDFFPLTVDVEERMYADGRIPGSFFRREGRPSTDAILACRLIDRPLRPGFDKGIRNEVQVVVTVLAIDPDEIYNTVAINAASMSTTLSGAPFGGPVGGVRLALIAQADGTHQWVCFPKHSQLENAVFDMAVAGRVVTAADGTEDVAIMMVEAEATDNSWDLIQGGAVAPSEDIVAEGLEASKPFIKALCEAQSDLKARAGKPAMELPYFGGHGDDVAAAVKEAAGDRLAEVYAIAGKQEREDATDELHQSVLADLTGEGKPFADRLNEVNDAYQKLTKETVRQRILRDGVRIDGRGPKDIRELTAMVEILPRVHGSAIFQRGETQIMGVTTLNMLKLEQQIDSLSPVKSKRYMHHYNFPPYSTGETGRVGSPKRREIGHGALAERALAPVIPSREEFPYAIRQVSEALGSNGSTSMGSVCASTLSMLNAGVPLRAPVAGIAMGLVTGQVDGKDAHVALTDILGAEDALGDMDFKVAGTKDFVTAIQLDTKLDGIPSDVLDAALGQAREARLAILDVINAAIDAPDEMSEHAPRIITVNVPVSKIGEVIGPKGKMINQIQEDTGADISIEDDGTVYIGAVDGPSAEAARSAINAIANPQVPEVGERYLGTVVKTTTFGAFVSLTPGRDGLLHVTELRKLNDGKRVNEVEDVVSVGQQVQVEITKVDDRGKLSLSPVVAEDDSADSADSAEAAEEA
ncbi:polyribonucleotide nucleotidyltransferase [Kocuria sp.]|uniref:polyribonucleotide nucleotidyltransferase n=1 Tax=Kocuria sp. TaxID=1871328 RepID=UPI0026E097E0|nr:polyribonucleotide nucleotidyltransferase [Kocuria sp.]MDO5618749.1 polyribonucleotide nucleotidyltransferase [Kocuria sp.]